MLSIVYDTCRALELYKYSYKFKYNFTLYGTVTRRTVVYEYRHDYYESINFLPAVIVVAGALTIGACL